MSSLFRKKSIPAAGGRPTPSGVEHETCFPLLCQMGNDANRLVESLLAGRAQREYMKIIYYLVGRGLIDQFLLGKAYLGLMAVEAENPNGSLHALVGGPPSGGFGGAMEPVGMLYGAATHVFKHGMLSANDQRVFEGLCKLGLGQGAKPVEAMSAWSIELARAPQFPVLDLANSTVAVVLNPRNPPRLKPEIEGMEIAITVPSMGLGDHFQD